MRFTACFVMLCDILLDPIHVSTTVSESIIVTHVYHAFPILFMVFHTWSNLVISNMDGFDIILGITRLSPHYAFLNCKSMCVTLEIL